MHRVAHEEDEMDRQHRRLFAAMTNPGGWTHGIAVALDILRLDIYHERFADYAVAIALRVQKLNEDIPPTPNSQ
jgi:phosphate uptake regulator